MLRQLSFILFLVFPLQLFSEPKILNAVEENLTVNGKTTRVFNILQPNKAEGYVGFKGDFFDIVLNNKTSVPISIHWHGIILPNNQDGVPYVTQLPIQPGQSHHYYFKIKQAGTFWMHSHYKFHEQNLMTAPLTFKDKHDTYASDKEVTVMLQGFSFTKPEKIFYNLQHKKMMPMLNSAKKPDLNDVNFDAYLANRRTLDNPQVVYVKPNEKIRLRLINGSTATNFWVLTGKLTGKAISVDGNNIVPIQNTRFQLAVAQRLDLEVTVPKSGGVFPILAQVEGEKNQTGIILATKNATIPQLSQQAATVVPALNDQQEQQLHSLQPLSPKPIKTTLNYKLTGDMQRYVWKINDEIWPHIKPLKVTKGERVEMVFKNDTNMAHPMHLHGHVFQVSEINGNKLDNGPIRDTILVLPHSTKKIIFDADNPGIWMMHCHVLYHMAAGMMTTTNYYGYPEPSYYQQLIQ